ncbi:MAG: hypothetical protein J0I47_08460 [Sphingomonas sp.]|uniref:hypothetical protein n=1 Tax=Sphingomonas sp. TaxID=28214 RepID=UPI001ACB3F82|nr:hypothetical protein [Sphingomonas sp.]MBN8808255.1 hypothetical protein [Sphingomonas sp.]
MTSQRPSNAASSGDGEDEGSSSNGGDESHQHDDQKTRPSTQGEGAESGVTSDDPRKTEKLTHEGRDYNPDEAVE